MDKICNKHLLSNIMLSSTGRFIIYFFLFGLKSDLDLNIQNLFFYQFTKTKYIFLLLQRLMNMVRQTWTIFLAWSVATRWAGPQHTRPRTRTSWLSPPRWASLCPGLICPALQASLGCLDAEKQIIMINICMYDTIAVLGWNKFQFDVFFYE